MDWWNPTFSSTVPNTSTVPGQTGGAMAALQKAMSHGGQHSASQNYLRAFLELGEIPPGFQVYDPQGPHPLAVPGSQGEWMMRQAIAEANRAGSTALYKLGQQYDRGQLALRNALAARGILRSGETNYQLADLTKAFADAQAAARAAAMAQGAQKSQTGAAQVAADWTSYITQRAQNAMQQSLQPSAWNIPYTPPAALSGQQGGGSAVQSLQNLFGS